MDLKQLLPLLAQIAQDRGHSTTLTELADNAGLSPSHFQRAFARIAGESAKQFDKRLRLECAAALLLTTTRPIVEIAFSVGFSSHEGFTRAFRGQFGLSPKGFRARGFDGDRRALARHAELVQHVGPCLHLYRASLQPQPPKFKGTKTMSYDIIQKELPTQTLLCRSARCEQDAIAKVLGEVLPSVFRYATEAGITMVGPPTTRYLSWGPALISLQAGMPVAAGSKGEGDIEAVELPAGKVAVTVHTGPYDGLGDAHAAVERWIEANGLKPSGPPWEVYLTDPGEVPNPEEWKTEIVWPLEG